MSARRWEISGRRYRPSQQNKVAKQNNKYMTEESVSY